MPATENRGAELCPVAMAHAFNVHTMACVAPTAPATHAEGIAVASPIPSPASVEMLCRADS